MKRFFSKQVVIFICIVFLAASFIFFISKLLNSNFYSATKLENKEVVENLNIKNTEHSYQRNWQIPNPIINAQEVIVKEVGTNNIFFKQKVYFPWPLASITKLITAAVVLQNINLNTPILISTSTGMVEGETGNLKVGEIYRASDLVKIMLMASSNKAAVAFEEYLGKERFLELAKKVMQEAGMTNTVIYESSGLDDNNVGTPNDIELLLEYILEKYPQILTWTRIPSSLFQPLNSTRINEVVNIDPLNERVDFLGGKTGTSPKAKQNLATIIQFKDIKLAIVIMGSTDRFGDLDKLLDWIEKAYGFL